MKELPKINIKFMENVAIPVKLQPKGHAVLILKDTENTSNTVNVFKKMTDITGYSDDMTKYITDVFVGGASKVTVFNINESNTIDIIIKQLDQIEFNYCAVLSEDNSDHTKLSKFITTTDKKDITKKGVFYKLTNLDNKHAINIANEKVTFKDDRGEKDGSYVIPYILGVLCGMPLSRAATNYNLTELAAVKNVDDIETNQNKGNLTLHFDGEKVKILSGRNTLTTIDKDHPESMQSIVIIEALDLMRDDLTKNFKLYIGGYKNKYSTQMSLISSAIAYFDILEELEVLDPEYDNKMELDVKAMRTYWKSKGKDVEKLSDSVVKKMACGTNVFLKADIKILDVIENFALNVFFTV